MILIFPTSDSLGTLLSTLGLVGMDSAAAHIWEVTKFSYSSFGIRPSNIFCRVSNLFLTVTVYLLVISLCVSEEQL